MAKESFKKSPASHSHPRNMSVAELLRTEPLKQSNESAPTGEDLSVSAMSIPRAQQDSPTEVRRKIFDPARDLNDSASEKHGKSLQAWLCLVLLICTDVPAEDSSATPTSESESGSHSRYKLKLLQQPLAARACGHGERDRRVVDPPPILQLTLDDFDPESEDDQSALQLPGNIVHCTLLSVPHGKDVSATKDPFHPEKLQRRLMGTQATSAFVGTDPNIQEDVRKELKLGVFFIFSDVSCRHTGRYRLKFDLMTLTAQPNDLGSQASILASAVSEVFEVYNAKDFPGMKPSSDLARELRSQGANIPIKKGVDCVYGSGGKTKRRNRGNDSDEGMSDG